MSPTPTLPPCPDRIEWPTLAVIAGWYAALAVVLATHAIAPWYVTTPALAVVGALNMSLQHEAIHGHPTPWRRLNTALVGIPLLLWCPYREYRDSHLVHHAGDLTVPGADPESTYVTAATWEAAGPAGRALLVANRTLLGRMVIGPWISVVLTARRALRTGRDAVVRRTWGVHLLVAAATVWLIVGVIGLPAGEYAIGLVWGGTALTLLRSFAEHRYLDAGSRSAVVVSNRFFSLLFLNNNLHHTHHARPGAAWYRLPGLRREIGSDVHARGGAGWYPGYGAIARRFLVRPVDVAVHPAARPTSR